MLAVDSGFRTMLNGSAALLALGTAGLAHAQAVPTSARIAAQTPSQASNTQNSASDNAPRA